MCRAPPMGQRNEPLPVPSRCVGIVAKGLGVRAGEHWLFRDLDLDVGSGECLTLTGPNGSGKSTLLHLVVQTVRGPDVGLLALFLVPALPTPGALLVVAAAIALCVLR